VTLNQIGARVERLDQLSRGLAREISLIREANDPMLYLERKAYLAALGDALEGIENARIVLAKARQPLVSGKTHRHTEDD
jgi:hypothetical protein